MKAKRIINYLILFIVLMICPVVVNAKSTVNLYLFYGEGCPHCAAEEKFLKSYINDNSDIKLYKYEVWYDQNNQNKLKDVSELLNKSANGVPYLIIGDKVISGYLEGVTDEEIKNTINYFKNKDSYTDKVGEYLGIVEKTTTTKKTSTKEETKKNENVKKVSVPILGKVNPKKVSLPILATVLGLVDGFNPCAMWILIFLITMLFNMKDRKKMWFLGLLFILTSGVVYLLFMLTWLNLATFISKIAAIRLLVSIVALVAGFYSLNNYVKESSKKDGGCEVVDNKERKKIMQKIMKITKEKHIIIAALGIMLLAASVNIIEMMCSVGLPLLFTQILSMNSLSTPEYLLYMFVYILFFLIDDIIIFVISMITLKVTGISTKYAKYSHLIGGIIMIIIGVLLIVKPSLLMFNF